MGRIVIKTIVTSVNLVAVTSVEIVISIKVVVVINVDVAAAPVAITPPATGNACANNDPGAPG